VQLTCAAAMAQQKSPHTNTMRARLHCAHPEVALEPPVGTLTDDLPAQPSPVAGRAAAELLAALPQHSDIEDKTTDYASSGRLPEPGSDNPR